MIAAIYARVSTDVQHTENQIPELQAYADRNGWGTVQYLEEASGKQGSKRPALAQLLADATAHKFEVVIVWKMDRFGRSLKDFLANLEVLDKAGIRFITTSQPIDTDQRSPIGQLIMIILAAVAQFERDLIIERVRLGVKRNRVDEKAGRIGKTVHTKSGKDLPAGRPRKARNRKKILELLAQGMSWRAIAKEMKMGRTSVQRTIQEMQHKDL